MTADMETRRIAMPQLWTLLDEQLTHGPACLPVTGSSMWPMLAGGRDLVRLERSGRPPRRGEVVLYQREDGRFVLHRVIRPGAPEGWICCGDNQWEWELVPEERMLATVSAFRRKGRWRETAQPGSYRLYAWCWRNTLPVRRLLLKTLHLLMRARRGLRTGGHTGERMR